MDPRHRSPKVAKEGTTLNDVMSSGRRTVLAEQYHRHYHATVDELKMAKKANSRVELATVSVCGYGAV